MLTQERLRELFSYYPETGEFVRKVSIGTGGFGCKEGDVVGTVATNGYIRVRVDGKYYPRSHLVWLYIYGNLPKLPMVLDHINRNRQDDRLANIRKVTNPDNYKNMKMFETNSSGHTGVAWHKKASKWRAYIVVNYKQKHLGLFESINEAIAARDKANELYGFDPTHGKEPICV